MCGVLGISEGKQETLLREGLKMIEHRGPDDMGVFFDDFVTLGHQRLAIIDLSPLGSQPMTLSKNEKEMAVSFNGEIYNYQELKNNLVKQGCQFVGGSDTEVILQGYAKEGKAFFEKMRGMWAIAIYDAGKKEIVLSRDHFGIKPLYYSTKDNKLVFASEIKALKKIMGKLSPNTEAYYEFYNLGYFIGENTSYKEIKKVLPGEVLVWNLTNSFLSKNLLPLEVSVKKELDFEEAVDLVDRAIEDSVSKHYIADVPVGLLLSGGTDSSLIAALSEKIGKKPICYHIAIQGSIDTEYAVKIADHLGFELVSKELNLHLLQEEYGKMEEWLDQPSSDVSLLPTNLVYKYVDRDSKVVLSGEGGDELFGGYLRHNKLVGLNKVEIASGSLLNSFYSPSNFGLNFINPVVRRMQEKFNTDLVNTYLHNVKTLGFPISDKQIKNKLLEFYNHHPYKDLVPKNLFFDQFLYLTDSLMYKNDITSMVSSIEARVPLVDREVLRIASSLPDKFRLSPEYSGKKILKTILKKYLPENLVDRPKKGFGFSFDKLGVDLFVTDYRKAVKFHLDNAESFGLGQELRDLLSESAPDIICQKFPRFAFSLITNHKVMGKL